MKIAIDLDNTLFNFTPLFQRISCKRLERSEIRDLLKNSTDWPANWISLQGDVYGKYCEEVQLFPGVRECLHFLQKEQHELHLTSHKTSESYCGRYRLRESALKRISELGLNEFFPKGRIHFFDTSEEKIAFINNENFQICIDDLEKILSNLSQDIFPLQFSLNETPDFFTLPDWDSIKELFHFLKKPLMKYSAKVFESAPYFLKRYSDPERKERETYFMKKLAGSGDIFVPAIKKEFNTFIVTEKSELTPVTTITPEFLELMDKGLCALQTIENPNSWYATHAIRSVDEYILQIEQRMKRTPLPQAFSSLWLSVKSKATQLAPVFNPEKIIFPDFFKKNFWLYKNKLCLLDFESVGLGDPARVYLNSIHHFGHNLNDTERTLLKKWFLKNNSSDDSFVLRVKQYATLNAFEWLILRVNYLNAYSISPSSDTLLETRFANLRDNIPEGKYLSWFEDDVI